MGKSLIIVESPTKIKTLRKFLRGKYVFESSLGHVRDLPEKRFGIDTEHNFEPEYEILPGKQEVIKRLKAVAKDCDTIYLAPDPDREGEAIAWHIYQILPHDKPIKRITFNAITKTAVQDSLEHPRDIDMALVNAQQARRLLDRIVGYKISPILSRKIQRGKEGFLSAGRVQSVALKLVVDREREIDAFKPVEYWTLSADLKPKNSSQHFSATVVGVDGKKVVKEIEKPDEETTIPSEQVAQLIAKRLDKAQYKVTSIEKKEKRRNPVPPFITSTLQQEASRHFGFSASRTMGIAQSLYEGVDLGNDGAEGLITYMRTDSVRVSPEAETEARDYIMSEFGKDYVPEKPPVYASKKNAQDAHEAIRPTSVMHSPEQIKSYLQPDQYKIYGLIWRRFLASQMTAAIYDTVSATIETNDRLLLRASGSIVKFKGFLAIYEEKHDSDENDENRLLPPMKENEMLSWLATHSNQSFTKPPPRFTEASLVKELEKCGIGRPSTYATIMNKIQSRDYTVKDKKALKPTELGKIICQMLEENFGMIMDVTFTAHMEQQLDLIAEENKEWKTFIKKFWGDFEPLLETAAKEAKVPKIDTDIICPKCGGKLQKIWAKNRYFYGCANYPDCDFTATLETYDLKKEDYRDDFDWDQPCPKCGKPMVLRSGKFGPFLGCTDYPNCRGIVNLPKKGELSQDELPPCPAIGCDGKIVQRRSRFGKPFFACSNFPDCDVIANSIEQLEEKYQSRPKTAYISKKPKKETSSKSKKKGSKDKEDEKGKKKAPAKKSVKKTTKKAASKKKAPAQKSYTLSKELSDIVGEENLSRPEITKKLWDYIKEHELQDPKNKRRIVPDKKLAKLFGSKEPLDMMKLASIISNHVS